VPATLFAITTGELKSALVESSILKVDCTSVEKSLSYNHESFRLQFVNPGQLAVISKGEATNTLHILPCVRVGAGIVLTKF